MYTYKCVVTKVVDGDTIYGIADMGFNTFKKVKLRFARINAPEIRTKNMREKTKGLKAKKLIKDLIEANNNEVIINTTKKGKYGRWIAEIWIKNINLSDYLFQKRLAKRAKY